MKTQVNRMRRSCKRCHKMYLPSGKYSKICDDCKPDYQKAPHMREYVDDVDYIVQTTYSPLKRPCSRCNKLFIPISKLSKVCNSCNKNLNGYRKKRGPARDYISDEDNYPEKVKYQNRYKKGREVKCHSQYKN